MTTAKKSQFSGLAGIVNKKPAEQPAEQTELVTLTPPTSAPTEGKGRWKRGEGKSSNPDYERMTVYVRKETRKAAERKWEDETNRESDLSDLAELLLTKYLNT